MFVMPQIIVENVSKRFRLYQERNMTLKDFFVHRKGHRWEEFWALKDVNLEVERGEMVALLGRNGSGKSTLLKLLTRILYPDFGVTQVKGRVSSLLELGAGFHPEFTGRENIFMNASIFGLTRSEIEERYDEIVKFSELEDFINYPVRSYSSGMYMRLAFSVAISVEPDVLLIDEILAVGDAGFQAKCLERIRSLKRSGKTIVLVTHDTSVVERMCDRALWLNKGRVEALGISREVVSEYLNFVADEEGNRHNEENVKSSTEKEELNQTVEAQMDEKRPEEQRKGNRAVEITKVTIASPEGREQASFRTGAALMIEIHYLAYVETEDPVFGIGIVRSDGVHCYGVNTDIDSMRLPDLQAGQRGIVRFIVEKLHLLNGTYRLSVACHSRDGLPYDYHTEMYTFNVDSITRDVGVGRLEHRWVIE